MSQGPDHGWVSHQGRRAIAVSAPAELLTGLASDGSRLNRILLPHLDESASALSSLAPKWVFPPIDRSGRQPGFVALVTTDDHPHCRKVLVRSQDVPETLPTRVAIDLDLADVGYQTWVVARWDVAVNLSTPNIARGALSVVLGRRVAAFVEDLVADLGAAARDHLADLALPGFPAPAAAAPTSGGSDRSGTSAARKPVVADEPDAAADADTQPPIAPAPVSLIDVGFTAGT